MLDLEPDVHDTCLRLTGCLLFSWDDVDGAIGWRKSATHVHGPD